ncbi:hypothetical protein D3C77_594580 [compost metagenome]
MVSAQRRLADRHITTKVYANYFFGNQAPQWSYDLRLPEAAKGLEIVKILNVIERAVRLKYYSGLIRYAGGSAHRIFAQLLVSPDNSLSAPGP